MSSHHLVTTGYTLVLLLTALLIWRQERRVRGTLATLSIFASRSKGASRIERGGSHGPLPFAQAVRPLSSVSSADSPAPAHSSEGHDSLSLRFDDGSKAPGFSGPTDVDGPMLTDEERVRRAVDAEGGRMRQRELVELSGWTKTRVSRLVAALVDDDVLVKVQIGRENVLCLEDSVPEICRDVVPGSTASTTHEETDDSPTDDDPTGDESVDTEPRDRDG